MRFRCSYPVAFFGAIGLLATGTSAQTVVYDNTTTSLHSLVNTGFIFQGTVGNQVILEGPNRTIIELSFVVRIDGDAPAVIGLQPAFYGDETDPTPFGGQIWEGPIHERTLAPGVETLVRIPIPAVVVPEEFTYAVHFWPLGSDLTALGPVSFWPRTVGNGQEFGFWRTTTGPGGWFYDGPEVRPFGAQVKAVGPVPAASIWGLVVLTLLLAAGGSAIILRWTTITTAQALGHALPPQFVGLLAREMPAP